MELAANVRIIHLNRLSDFLERHSFHVQQQDRTLGIIQFFYFQTQFNEASLERAILDTLRRKPSRGVQKLSSQAPCQVAAVVANNGSHKAWELVFRQLNIHSQIALAGELPGEQQDDFVFEVVSEIGREEKISYPAQSCNVY